MPVVQAFPGVLTQFFSFEISFCGRCRVPRLQRETRRKDSSVLKACSVPKEDVCSAILLGEVQALILSVVRTDILFVMLLQGAL